MPPAFDRLRRIASAGFPVDKVTVLWGTWLLSSRNVVEIINAEGEGVERPEAS